MNNMSLGPQISAPGAGQQEFTPVAESSAEKKTEVSNGNSFMAAGFKADSLKVKEFIPKGVVVNTKEQFPDLDAMDAQAPKKKKKGKNLGADAVKVKVVEAEPELDESTPWKGKKSVFFVMSQSTTPAEVQDP
jgi:hypothetical protein